MEQKKAFITKPLGIGLLACLCCLLWGSATPAIKIGDGTSYLIDLPTVNGLSVSEAEKLFWNNKITCYLVAIDEEDIHENNLVFSKD